MEKLILRRERFIGFILIATYIVFVLEHFVGPNIFDWESWNRKSDFSVHYFAYIMVVLILMMRIIRETIIYARINEHENELVSRGIVWFEKLKGIALVVGHVLFWVSIINQYYVYMSIILLVIGSAMPNKISGAVYGAKEYFTSNGIRYYYDRISGCKLGEFSSIELKIDGKAHSLTWWDADESNKVYSYLERKLDDSGLGDRESAE